MPRRYLEDAPDVVKRDVIDIIAVNPAAPLDYDVIFRQVINNRRGGELAGLDFGARGEQGCHFFLDTHEMREYRARNRRNRVAWRDLPESTRRAVVRYCEEA